MYSLHTHTRMHTHTHTHTHTNTPTHTHTLKSTHINTQIHAGFVIDTIAGYVRTGSYSINAMEEREVEIRGKAETLVSQTLPRHKRVFFNWVLFHARRGVRHRENLRFARTKLFGVFRSLFRAIGSSLVALGLLKQRQDVFYLTVEEIFAFVDGRSVTNDIAGLVELRRREYDGYRKVGGGECGGMEVWRCGRVEKWRCVG